jgi:hypothetical protein
MVDFVISFVACMNGLPEGVASYPHDFIADDQLFFFFLAKLHDIGAVIIPLHSLCFILRQRKTRLTDYLVVLHICKIFKK